MYAKVICKWFHNILKVIYKEGNYKLIARWKGGGSKKEHK